MMTRRERDENVYIQPKRSVYLPNWFFRELFFGNSSKYFHNRSKVTSFQVDPLNESSFICIANKTVFFIDRNQLRINMSLPSVDRRCEVLHRSSAIPDNASRRDRSASTDNTCCSPSHDDDSSDWFSADSRWPKPRNRARQPLAQHRSKWLRKL